MTPIVYFSSASENTKRFVEKLGWPAHRIPLRRGEPDLHINEPYVLILPTYGGGDIAKAVPRQVIRFLNDPANRRWIKGVICSGNTNFGAAYCTAGPTIAQKCHVPELYRFELMGTDFDVLRVQEGLTKFFASPHFNRPPADTEDASPNMPAPPAMPNMPDMPSTAIATGREPQTTTSPTGELIA